MEVSFFIALMTHPFIALLVALLLFVIALFVYGETADNKKSSYSAYLRAYRRVSEVLLYSGIPVAIVTLFTLLIVGAETADKERQVLGIGVYVYGIATVVGLLFFTAAERAERKDIKGQHKQAVKRVLAQAEVQMTELQHYAKFQGKSGLKVQRLSSSLQKVLVEVKSEKRVLKNKKNIYRSLERLEGSETELKKTAGSIAQFQLEIENLYDRLYAFEAVLVNKRYEEERKKLNIAKETLDVDPYAVVHLFDSFEYMRRLPESNVEQVN